jgi:hypothetical protein
MHEAPGLIPSTHRERSKGGKKERRREEKGREGKGGEGKGRRKEGRGYV